MKYHQEGYIPIMEKTLGLKLWVKRNLTVSVLCIWEKKENTRRNITKWQNLLIQGVENVYLSISFEIVSIKKEKRMSADYISLNPVF